MGEDTRCQRTRRFIRGSRDTNSTHRYLHTGGGTDCAGASDRRRDTLLGNRPSPAPAPAPAPGVAPSLGDGGASSPKLARRSAVHLADAFCAPDANTLEVWVWSTLDRAMTPKEPREVAGMACSPFTHLDESRCACPCGVRSRGEGGAATGAAVCVGGTQQRGGGGKGSAHCDTSAVASNKRRQRPATPPPPYRGQSRKQCSS
jgi:hypothetical protein